MAEKTVPRKTTPFAKVLITVGILLVLGLVGAYWIVHTYLFDPTPPSANYSEPKDRLEAQLQDLDYMANFLELDRSFSPKARAGAAALLENLKENAGSYSDPEFELMIAKVLALADNAHSNVSGFRRAGKYSRLPVRTYWFADGFYVVRAHQGFEHLLGGQIVAVDGLPMAEVEGMLRPYIGGPEEYFHAFQFSYLFEFPAFLHAAGITAAADEVTLTLEFADGRRQDVMFKGDYANAKGPAGHPYHMLYRAGLTGEEGWANALQALDAVDFTLESARSFETRALPEMNAFYIRYWSNEDGRNISISQFNGEVKKALNSAVPLNAIILDVRNNRGGNYFNNKDVMLALGSYLGPDGRLYIITGRDTFSAGMFSAAFAKGGAGDKAVIIGTRVGDRDLHWGENDNFTLPNSGVRTVYSRGLHNLTGPCEDIWKCYWDDYFSYQPVASLDPDILVPFTFADYAAGHDPAMDKIREIEGAK